MPANQKAKIQKNLLKAYLEKEFGLELNKITKIEDKHRLDDIYQSRNDTLIAIQHSDYHLKDNHYWFGVSERKMYFLMNKRAYTLFICGNYNRVLSMQVQHLKEFIEKVEPSGEKQRKWHLNITSDFIMKIHDTTKRKSPKDKDREMDISNCLNDFSWISLKTSLEEEFAVTDKQNIEYIDNLISLEFNISDNDKKYTEGKRKC